MLSSVLNSELAIQVNIQIMRAFSRLRQMLATHEDLRRQDRGYGVEGEHYAFLQIRFEQNLKPEIGSL